MRRIEKTGAPFGTIQQRSLFLMAPAFTMIVMMAMMMILMIDIVVVVAKPVRPLHHSSRRHNPLSVEQGLWQQSPAAAGILVLGSDESGTGAIAGPIVTATVACLDPFHETALLLQQQSSDMGGGVRDAKTLDAAQRETLFQQVMEHPLYRCTIAIRQADEIDAAASTQEAVNQAFGESVSAMVEQLQSEFSSSTAAAGDNSNRPSPWNSFLSIVDGKSSIPNLPITSRPWIKGDTTVYTIALASIVAQVTRDRLVQEAAQGFDSAYAFGQHGGYPSRAHWHALHTLGPIASFHRKSCKLVRQRSDSSSTSTTTSPSPATTTTRSDFLQQGGALVMALATGAAVTTTSPESASAMYTDKKTGIQFPEVGEIASAIPTPWNDDDDDDDDDIQELTDKSRFQRLDSTSDAIFYQEPRFVEHVDDTAVARMTEYLNLVVVAPPEVHAVLDLCSSWTSHLPPSRRNTSGSISTDDKLQRVAGLGMNAQELQANPSLTEWTVADLNEKPVLPYTDSSFDAVVCQLSIDYLTQPVQVCREIGRVLKPDGKVHILFSNRLFIQKAVALWTGADDIDHAYTVGRYLRAADSFTQIAATDLSTRKGGKIVGDPVYVVTAVRI